MDTQNISVPLQRLAFSVAETVTMSGLSRATLYRLSAAGKLRTVHQQTRRPVPRAEVERLCGVEAAGTAA